VEEILNGRKTLNADDTLGICIEDCIHDMVGHMHLSQFLFAATALAS
jgi:hypothetical protein